MIAVVGIGKAHGERTLFEGVTLSLNAGSRYGLVGANGSGKSTFLRMLAGDEPATDGTINIPKRARVGVLRQDRFLDEEARILDLAMMGDDVVWGALEEQRALLADGASGDGASRVVELEERIRLHDGYTLEARAARVLEGLGIPVAIQGQQLRTLSGGFRLRVLLAQVLVGRPEALLLDEPTNHLDILSIRWLEKFLADYTGCAVVVSHDQRFLENFVTHVLDVDYDTITEYAGGYQAFLVAKEAEHTRRGAEIARVQKEIADKKAFVERFRAKATKARQAQSRLKQIEKIEIPELVQSSRQSPRFKFVPARASGKDVLVVSEVSKAFGEKRVLTNVSLAVRRGERIAVIGPNGVGKSTLLKIVVGRLAPDAGAARWGHETRVGYFAQEHREVLTEPSATALEVMAAASPAATNSQVRGALGAVLFSGDDVHKRVGKLSGGEAARLVFAVLSSQQPNVLVLDEPTNHLDIEAIDALADAVIAFEGTVLFVSHDRWLVSRIATRVVEVREEGLRDFVGTYEEYLERCGDDHLDAETVVLRAKQAKRARAAEPAAPKGNGGEAAPPPSVEAKPAAVQASWEEQKRLRNRRKELPKRRDQIMAAIEAAEARKKEIQEIYLDPQFYMKTGADEIARIERDEKTVEKSLVKLMAEWESIEREIEQAATEGAQLD